MSVSLPKKKRIVIILVILSSRVQEAYDNDTQDGIAETILFQLGRATPTFLTNENTWSARDADIWDAVDAIVNYFDASASLSPSLEELSANLEKVLG